MRWEKKSWHLHLHDVTLEMVRAGAGWVTNKVPWHLLPTVAKYVATFADVVNARHRRYVHKICCYACAC